MKSLIVRLSLLPAVLFLIAFVTPSIGLAQENRPAPESPPSESPKPEPPSSPPAESPRNDPPPSPPAESPRNDPPPSPPAEAPRSEAAPSTPSSGGGRSNNDNGGSRNNDGGSSRGNNDNRRNDNDNRRNNDGGNRNSGSNRTGSNPPVANNEGGGRVRGTMSGDGSGNRRDRVIETESGDVIVPGRSGFVNPNGNPGPGNPAGGNPGGNPGGNRGGSAGGDNRDGRHRGGDGDRDRWRDRHRDGRGHRHYRGDACYQVPTYDDTVSYSAVNYPDYDRDDSLSAYELGYNDGLYTGANDGRRGQTYDPERSRFYKRTPGYHPSKGTRDAYQHAYQDGFLRGYREGYQNWQKYFVGGRFKR
jgi:hypothetical protein